MEDEKRRQLIRTQKLEDVPELIHQIQSLFPTRSAMYKDLEKHRKHLMIVEHMLLGYLRDNIPLEKINLETYIWNHEVGSLAEKCIRLLSTESCLKELQLAIGLTIDSFTIPDELFCVKTLIKMVIRSPVIKWSNKTSLQRLRTYSVASPWLMVKADKNPDVITFKDPVLGDNYLMKNSPISIAQDELLSSRVLKEFKVRNLLYLRESTIQPHEKNHTLEIYDVPNIRSFAYGTPSQRNHLPFNRCVFGNVTELSLDGVIISDAFSDLIKSKFHCLENLTLKWSRWGPKSLDITCLTLKRLFLLLDRWNRGDNYINVQIYAPKLHIFKYHGMPVPNLKFSAIVPKQIKLVHKVYSYGFDDSFFPKIREALMLTSEFD
nr:hypothetical protein [Tanacetum cinerariifolium]